MLLEGLIWHGIHEKTRAAGKPSREKLEKDQLLSRGIALSHQPRGAEDGRVTWGMNPGVELRGSRSGKGLAALMDNIPEKGKKASLDFPKALQAARRALDPWSVPPSFSRTL
jgi:hypothetical protein